MSIIYCEKHDRRWDSDKLEDCPVCESTPDVYKDNGYDSRDHYLQCLVEDYGVELATVKMLAQLLGPNEDFDGLVTSLEDYSE